MGLQEGLKMFSGYLYIIIIIIITKVTWQLKIAPSEVF